MDIKIFKTFPDELEAEWNALLDETANHVPFLRYEYLRMWWQTRGGGEWPDADLVLITANQDGRLKAAAPLFYTSNHLGSPALLLVGSIEISDYLDLLARPEDLPVFITELLSYLKQNDLSGWQNLDLYNLLDSSPSLPALEAVAKQLNWNCHIEELQHSPYIPLPGDWDTYLAGIDKKQRHEIRRKMRRVESADVPVRWYLVEDSSSLEAEAEAFMALMAQDPEKAVFLTDPMRRHMHLVIECAFKAGCLNLAFLEINGKKAAGYLSFDYLNRLWVYNSGLDRSYNEYSPGWVLLGYLLQWANQNKYEAFDFMRGNEEYKYRFGAKDRFVMRATLRP